MVPLAARDSSSASSHCAGGVELEAQRRAGCPSAQQRRAGRFRSQVQRDDEAHGRRCASEHVVQRPAGLAQRQVQRRALQRPAPVGARDVVRGRPVREEVKPVEVSREAVQRPAARERQHRPGPLNATVLGGLVGDVLAHALVPAAREPEDRREAPEPGRDAARETIERVAVDDHRQVGESLVRGRGRRAGHRVLRA